MCIALSQHHAALTSSQGITLLLLSHVPCFVRLSITLLSQVLCLPLDIFQATRSIAPRCYKVVQ